MITRAGGVIPVRTRIYLLTGYLDYLLENGFRSEEAAVGDASRFLRHLLAKSTLTDVDEFVAGSGRCPEYRRRLRRSLLRFLRFARDELGLPIRLDNGQS